MESPLLKTYSSHMWTHYSNTSMPIHMNQERQSLFVAQQQIDFSKKFVLLSQAQSGH